MSRIIFSGVQPSGAMHIGNYLGAIQNWVNIQNENPEDKFIFAVVDLHSMTVPYDPENLRQQRLSVAAWFLAAGLDPEKTSIFAQSENPDHAYLAWIFDCITPMGWMERMTQYKDKSKKQGEERTSVGLFHYPSLMAADILLYNTDLVPVGEDQTQHVELTRDIADKFNNTFGQTFKLPDVMIQKAAPRIMSLQNPESKMSKSEKDPMGTINLEDEPDLIRKKISRAVTDSGNDIVMSVDKPAVSNLLRIYAAIDGSSIESLQDKYKGATYSTFKEELAEAIVTHFEPIQKRYHELMNNKEALFTILDKGAVEARRISSQKIQEVSKVTGLTR